MAAVYPGAVHPAWTPVVDNSSPVVANDINPVYLEVVAIESTLGATPNVSTTGTGTFYQDGRTFPTVASRLANIENGVTIGVLSRVSLNGGSQILADSGQVGLSIKSNGTNPLVNFLDSSNNVVTSIGKDGFILSLDGGTA